MTSNDPNPYLRNCPPRIAILGWGSLIWEPRELETIGEWQMGGPVLPIEFSRVSNDGRLTLVVDEKNGVDVPTRYILSSRSDLADAIENLRAREKVPSNRGIGVFDRRNELRNDHVKRSAPAAYSRISAWATECAMDGVIWTAITPRFLDGKDFSVLAAVDYLAGLEEPIKAIALAYIRNAPPEVATPVRERVAQLLP
jgi:hypothetical protein